jgi:hypothetical protein
MFRTACLLALLFGTTIAFAQKTKKGNQASREYIALTVYHAADTQQLGLIENYLQGVMLPTLAKRGHTKVGVFTMVGNDTASDKRVYVLTAFPSLAKWEEANTLLQHYHTAPTGRDAYSQASHNQPPYTRYETVLMQAFSGMPQVKAPQLQGNRAERVYELRSYESATEALHLNKVAMFNNGELQLFDRLGFNAVFYGQVVAGSRMPNLVYMTSFENKAARDEHWKTFGNHPDWKAMSSNPIYQNNMNKMDIVFLTPTAYSRL